MIRTFLNYKNDGTILNLQQYNMDHIDSISDIDPSLTEVFNQPPIEELLKNITDKEELFFDITTNKIGIRKKSTIIPVIQLG